MNRNALPGWVNAGIDAVADAPDSWIGRRIARRWGAPAPRGTVPTTTFDDRPYRVLIAPVNYSGQGRAWARALESADPSISARNMAVEVPGGFAFDADVVVPVGTYHNDPDWQRRQLDAATSATHVLVEAEEPPFGRALGRSVAAQAAALADAGVDVAFIAHGTDVRLPSRHRQRSPWSHFDDPSIYAPRLERLAARNIELLERSGRPVFVSTPDLLVDLPGASWCPVVVDLDRWTAPRAPRGDRLRVTHAPSVGPVKGTALVRPTLERLAADGTISLEMLGTTPSAAMPAVFAGADVVVDQFRIGSYGVAACEAMAAGSVVVGHVADDVRQSVRDLTGLELPVVEATPDTLDAVLRGLATADLAPLQAAGRSFAEAVHDGRMSADVLIRQWIARVRTHVAGEVS